MTRDDFQEIHRDRLPERYLALLPTGSPRHGWRVNWDETGYLMVQHDHLRHSLFLFHPVQTRHLTVFQLPWTLLLEDIVVRGGAILHGGLIARDEMGYILTAPPGGGKSTCIARLPHDWLVLADDACLIWPGSPDGFLASPLPTWSVLLGRTPILPSIARWRIGTVVPVRGILLLKKSDRDHSNLLSPYDRLLPLYRALCEHPQVLRNRVSFGTRLFDVARGLARTAPVSELHVTRDGRFWDQMPTDTH